MALFFLCGAEYSQDVSGVSNHLPGQHFYLQSQCLSFKPKLHTVFRFQLKHTLRTDSVVCNRYVLSQSKEHTFTLGFPVNLLQPSPTPSVH